MNTGAQYGIRQSHKIETHFVPFQRFVSKAKRLTYYQQMEQAEKKLLEFETFLLEFEVGIEDSEALLIQEKRQLMSLPLEERAERQRMIKTIESIEENISRAKMTLGESEERYEALLNRLPHI